MSRAVVFEPRAPGSGHYFNFAALVCEALLADGVEVTLLTHEKARDDPSFQTEFAVLIERGPATGGLTVAPHVPAHLGHAIGLRAQLELARWLLRYPDLGRSDWLYLPTADGLLQALALLRLTGTRLPASMSGADALILNGRAGYPGSLATTVKSRLSRALARQSGIRYLHWLDPNAACNGRVMPEPVEPMPALTRAEARRALGLNPGLRLTVALGRQDRRKGTDLLLDSFARVANPDQDLLLIAGTMEADARASLGVYPAAAAPIKVIDGYLDESTLLTALLAADLVALPYRTPFMSSGLLLRAAAAQRMVFTDSRGYLGSLTRRCALGVSVPIDDPKARDEGLREALQSCQGYSAGPLARSLSEFHNRANFQAHWLAGLRDALGTHRDVQPLHWRKLIQSASEIRT